MKPAKKEETIGSGPIEPQYQSVMRALGVTIDEVLNDPKRERRTGYVLMVFPFENFDGRCNYISNARREDVVLLLKEQLAYFQGQPEVKGKA